MDEIRIQKYIADCGKASRRSAEALVEAGRVTVNGVRAFIGQKIVPGSDEVKIDGRKVVPAEGEKTYVLLNKPAGVLCTAKDDRGRKTVCDLVRIPGKRLFPAGRLDMYSDGLIILSDDGETVNRIIHPSHNLTKTYVAEVTREVTEEDVLSLSSPIEIDGRATLPATIFPKGKTTVEFTIGEGRNRQIRRLCERAGLKIKKLTRIRIGEISDGSLAPGKWRLLTDREIEYLKGL
jgi:23S rRNA pseudouridine2605 synthase